MHHGRIEEQSPRPTSLAKWYNRTNDLIPGGEYSKQYPRGDKRRSKGSGVAILNLKHFNKYVKK